METDGQSTPKILRTIEAAGDVTVERALVGVVNGRDVHLTQAGAGPVIAKGDVSIEQGGCQSVIAAGGATLGRQSFVGMVVSPRVTVEDGARVLMNVPQAAAFGAALGAVFAVLSRLARR